jgi:hypothetical protein
MTQLGSSMRTGYNLPSFIRVEVRYVLLANLGVEIHRAQWSYHRCSPFTETLCLQYAEAMIGSGSNLGITTSRFAQIESLGLMMFCSSL